MFSKLSINAESIQPNDIIDTQDGLGHWFEVGQVSVIDEFVRVFPYFRTSDQTTLSLERGDEVFVLRRD